MPTRRERGADAAHLAIGVISAPEYAFFRDTLRAAWLRPHNPAVTGWVARFAVRSHGAPEATISELEAEIKTHGDLVRLPVPWNETRLRGPILSTFAWYRFALRNYRNARWLVKTDDDMHIVPHEALDFLRGFDGDQPTPRPFVYMGGMTW